MRVVLLAVALMLTACGSDEEGDPFFRMLEQPRYDTYESGPFFQDGKVLRRPPRGTVSRAGPGAGAADAPEDTQALLDEGRSRFRIYCAPCHGEGGYGGGAVAVHLPPEERPPPLRGLGVDERTRERVFEQIRNGSGRMPSYASELSVRESWAVVAWVASLRSRGAEGPEEVRDSLRAEALRTRGSGGSATEPRTDGAPP